MIDGDAPDRIIVELKPYRERRRTRALATGVLLGLIFSAFVIPAIVELVGELLDALVLEDPSAVDRIRDYVPEEAQA